LASVYDIPQQQAPKANHVTQISTLCISFIKGKKSWHSTMRNLQQQRKQYTM